MRSGELLVGCFLFGMVWGFVGGAAPSLGDQCSAEFQKVTTCLTFATGKADTPTKECCTSVAGIKDKDPVCLCYIIQQIHSGSNSQIKNMGIQEARLLQLPSACKLKNASSAECPQLLHLAPNSPDAAIFTNTSSTTTSPPAATSSGTSSSPTKADEKSNGFAIGVPQLTGGLVAIAMVMIFRSVFPRGF